MLNKVYLTAFSVIEEIYGWVLYFNQLKAIAPKKHLIYMSSFLKAFLKPEIVLYPQSKHHPSHHINSHNHEYKDMLKASR